MAFNDDGNYAELVRWERGRMGCEACRRGGALCGWRRMVQPSLPAILRRSRQGMPRYLRTVLLENSMASIAGAAVQLGDDTETYRTISAQTQCLPDIQGVLTLEM